MKAQLNGIMLQFKNTSKKICVFVLDGTIEGGIDIQIHGCIDPDSQGFTNLPENGCKETEDAFNLNEWGTVLDTTFSTSDGVACTSNTSASNHPMGKIINRSLQLYILNM